MPLSVNSRRAALVVAHPSHELRIHGWLEQARPYVCILTDGRGRSGEPRLSRTSALLNSIGATQGSIYGRLTDLEVYAAVLNGDAELFSSLVEELADAFVEHQIEYVVGDAAEGYNVAHDICRTIINAAVERAKNEHDHQVANFDFLLVTRPDESETRDDAITLHLDDGAYGRKIEAAIAYSPKLARDVKAAFGGAQFQGVRRFSEPQLAGEVDVEVKTALLEALESEPTLKAQFRDMIDGLPLDAFRVECFRPVGNDSANEPSDSPLFYEIYGEKLVAAGRYDRVIRYREHMLPLAQAIRNKTEREELCVRSAS